jgi:Fe-Mn family superoxide dismutase
MPGRRTDPTETPSTGPRARTLSIMTSSTPGLASSTPSDSLDRRALLTSGTTLAALGAISVMGAGAMAQPALRGETPAAERKSIGGYDAAKGEYVLPPLPYDKAALEPHIDSLTMEIHHTKHHKAYVDGLNKALKALAEIREGGDAGLVKHWSREVSFHGSGHINHTLFWNMMAPAGKGGGGQPQGPLAEAIARDFGGYDKFVAHFKAAATQVEGGGWAWLAVEPLSKRLIIVQQEKQQDMMPTNAMAVLGIDVWEHAYYVKYQNKRSEYVNAFMNVINWQFCQARYSAAM